MTPGSITSCANGVVNITTGGGSGSGALWQLSPGNVGINTFNNVGIGTTATDNAALTVMSGNVGIGTWKPTNMLSIGSGSVGNVGIGTTITSAQISMYLNRPTGANIAYVQSQDSTASGLLRISNDIGTNGSLNIASLGSTNTNTSLTTIPNSARIQTGTALTTLILGSSASTGQMIFSTAGNTFANERMRIDSTGNIGIGTITPFNKLDLSASDTGVNPLVSSASMQAIINPDTTAGNFSDLAFGTNNSSGARVYPAKWSAIYTDKTAGSEDATLQALSLNNGVAQANMTIKSDGNVGIGTTIPAFGLDVTPDGRFRNNLRMENGKFLSFGSTAGEGMTGNQSTNTVSLRTNGTNRLNIDVNGNVGIGTTTPVGGLSVMNGNVGIGTWVGSGGALVVKGGNVGIGTTIATQALTVGGTIYSTSGGFQFPDNTTQTTAASGSGTVNSGTANFVAKYASTGTAVSASSILYDNGTNIGIGATPGSYKLDIFSSIPDQMRIRSNNYSGYFISSDTPGGEITTGVILAGGNDGLNLIAGLDAGNNGKKVAIPYFTGSNWRSSLEISNTTGGADGSLLLVKTQGNVGIGTSVTAHKLVVAGTVYSTSGGFRFPDNTTQTSAATGTIGGSVSSGYIPRANGSNTITNGTIQDNGTEIGVGIGPSGGTTMTVGGTMRVGTSDAVKLNGSGSATGERPAGPIVMSSTGNLFFGASEDTQTAGTQVGATYVDSSSGLRKAWSVTNGTTRGTLNLMETGGNVGIGTTLALGTAIMNGNVGIGTWIPSSPFTVKGTTITQKLTGANTACSTTCGAFACYGGFDTALATGDVWVDCADATADKCQCSK